LLSNRFRLVGFATMVIVAVVTATAIVVAVIVIVVAVVTVVTAIVVIIRRLRHRRLHPLSSRRHLYRRVIAPLLHSG
jgi:hypothetical protein